MDYQELGTVSLEPHHHELIAQYAEVILNGTFEKAKGAFEIIFEREPASDFEMEIFKLICQEKLLERTGENFGIKGVFDGGRKH